MFDAINTALTGLSAAGARLNVAASNIANAESDKYAPKRADLVEVGDGQGVQVAALTDLPAESDHLASDLIDLNTSAFLYTANAAVVRAADHTLGTLLNILDHDNDPRDHA